MKAIIVAILAALVFISGWSQTNTPYQRTQDIVYGRKDGMALTMDVFQPQKPNGIGIIFIVSGGWVSSHNNILPAACQPLLDHGYTVFTVVHGSQPRYIIPDAVQDIHRAARFIRHNATTYGIDPKRLGVMGGSAGGHLSLMLATQAGYDAKANSKDPIDHESSAVQCVACFFPPTDFLNYGAPGVEGDGVGILKDFKPAFGSQVDTEEGRQKLGREISPIYFLTTNFPPALIFHGDADKLVPIQQSESFAKKATELGDTVRIVVKPGQGHGWAGWLDADMKTSAEWFDEKLRGMNHDAGK